MEFIYAFITGLCLCASTGFRIFIPYLVISAFTSCGILVNDPGLTWASGHITLILFGLALLTEVWGYYNPWMGNMLDLITSPMAIISGILLMEMTLPEMNGFLRWVIIIFAGGGTGFCTKLLNVRARLHTSIFKNGKGDYVFATIEIIFGFIVSILALTNPYISLCIVILYVLFITRVLKYEEKQKKLLLQ